MSCLLPTTGVSRRVIAHVPQVNNNLIKKWDIVAIKWDCYTTNMNELLSVDWLWKTRTSLAIVKCLWLYKVKYCCNYTTRIIIVIVVGPQSSSEWMTTELNLRWTITRLRRTKTVHISENGRWIWWWGSPRRVVSLIKCRYSIHNWISPRELSARNQLDITGWYLMEGTNKTLQRPDSYLFMAIRFYQLTHYECEQRR